MNHKSPVLLLLFHFLCESLISNGKQCGCPSSMQAPISMQDYFKYDRAFNELVHNDSSSVEHLLVNGDMLMAPGDWAEFHGLQNRRMRTAMPRSYRWPNRIVYFALFDFNPQDERLILNSLSELERNVKRCVTFKRVYQGFRGHYARVGRWKSGCFSTVGKVRQIEQQMVNLEIGCMTKKHVQHEFMHTLGLLHEQNRMDRSDYINVYDENIETEQCHNFKVCTTCSSFRIRFNVKSIMQYSEMAFSCNGEKTMASKRRGETLGGQVMTREDIALIRTYYQCKAARPTALCFYLLYIHFITLILIHRKEIH